MDLRVALSGMATETPLGHGKLKFKGAEMPKVKRKGRKKKSPHIKGADLKVIIRLLREYGVSAMQEELGEIAENHGGTQMDAYFALFNGHINDASDKAERSFKKKFGVKEWDKHIQPYIDEGVMSIFDDSPNKYTAFYVERVQYFVNKGRIPA
jgi:hypothetical protein